MSYSLEKMNVENLYFIPKFFFVPEIIEQRKPLSPTARRAGWIGCNILLDKIPLQGRIPIIQNSVPVDKQIVINQVARANRIRTADLSARGWMFDILHCINGVDGDIFTLEEIYRYETVLLEKYPCNHNIRAKIRQQLQLLRDKGFITFLGNGVYQKCGL